MGLLDFITKKVGATNQQTPEDIEKSKRVVGGVEVKTIEVGTSGTEIFSGYLSEEYLQELTGKDWMDKIDMMRRSDPNIKMVLGALKSPIKSANCYVTISEKVPEADQDLAEMQKLIVEKALFHDIDVSFTKLVGEVLTSLDFGYSLFDITHQVKTRPEIGTYNTLKCISYRSQRTIERWNIVDGRLKTVLQISNGDLGSFVNMDAQFLLHFCPEQEGDNYEGVAIVRPMYGNWLRKNQFLRYLAAGIEKYAIPTPVLTVPKGAENSPEYKAAKEALKCYVSGQANYLILPEGWKLEFNNVTFDSDKLRATIDFENKEMVNAILASFLLLGQNGAGSLALSGTLSDFYSQTITYIADHITEQFQRKIIDQLIRMNMGDVPVYVSLKFDSLEEKADQSWANMIKTLKDSGLISTDKELEDFVREKYKLPVKSEEVTAQPQPDGTQPPTTPTTLAEKKKTKVQSAEANLIRDTSAEYAIAGKKFLKSFANKYIKAVLSAKSKANSANEIKAPVNANVPSLDSYTKTLKAIGYKNAIEANQIQEKKFRKTKKKLAEFNLANTKFNRVDNASEELLDALKILDKAVTPQEIEDAIYIVGRVSDKVSLIFADYLSFEQKQKIDAKAQVLSDTQKQDTIKPIDFQYQSSLDYADDDQLEKDMMDAADKYTDGSAIDAASDVQASKSTNDALLDAANEWSDETGDSIVSYTFVAIDDDVTTELCSELNDHTFDANDPEVFKYSPPLHFNCRSYMQVNTASMKDNPEISPPVKLSKKAQGQLQFSEVSKKTKLTKKRKKVT